MGEDYEAIHSAFKNAKVRKLYESVLHVNARKQKTYAMTNANEYFVELTETSLGKNDFFPFTREDLKKHDPVGFELMESVWGIPSRKE